MKAILWFFASIGMVAVLGVALWVSFAIGRSVWNALMVQPVHVGQWATETIPFTGGSGLFEFQAGGEGSVGMSNGPKTALVWRNDSGSVLLFEKGKNEAFGRLLGGETKDILYLVDPTGTDTLNKIKLYRTVSP